MDRSPSVFESLFSLEGRVALVTGASKGLGFEMARVLAAAGAEVVLTSRHLEEVAEAAARIREETGRRTLGLEADTGDARQVDAAVERLVAEFGHLDILVNNAGINRHALLPDVTEEDWNAVLQIDLAGPMLCSRAAARHMIPRRYGRIVNIASIFGLVGFPKRSAYCAAKGGLVNLTRCHAIELAEFGITVNCICPGPFETPMTATLVQGPAREEFTRRIPLGRWGHPRELAGAVLYLVSDAAAFTTGAVLAVDGGWTAI